MKLGISYNVFEGEELLEESITRIKDHVDFVSAVYQTTSNFNIPCSNTLLPVLNDLKERGLIHELIHYDPTSKQDYHKRNQVEKRNIGLQASKDNECTHHMALDTDEYYITSEFENLKKDIIKNRYETTACHMLTYYKDKIYILDPPETYCVPLIFKINKDTEFVFNLKGYPAKVDSSRMTTYGKFKKYNRNEIQMHHLSYVRKNLNNKLHSHGARQNIENQVDEIIKYHSKWKYPQQALLPGRETIKYNIKKVDYLS